MLMQIINNCNIVLHNTCPYSSISVKFNMVSNFLSKITARNATYTRNALDTD